MTSNSRAVGGEYALPTQTLQGISKALEPHMEVLNLAVVKAVLGVACETHLDDLAGMYFCR